MKIDLAVCKRFNCPQLAGDKCNLILSHNQVAENSGDDLWDLTEVPENCIHLFEFIQLDLAGA